MSRPKILIVDDEKPTRDVMARILSSSCECLTAPDAELAMQTLDANSDVALLITDYKMPGENGEVDNYVDGFRALKQMGYDKYVSFECGCNGDKEILVPAAVELLRSQWELA